MSNQITPPSILPRPEAFFGVIPGEDRVLVRWDAMLRYFDALAEGSDRLIVERIGTSTDGREMVMLIVANPDILADLATHREKRASLTDRALLLDPAQSSGATAGHHAVVLVTSAIHATEVGSVQLCPELAYELVTANSDDARRMRDNTIVLIVPTLNPDGMDLVHDWYEQTLGSDQEGTSPPALYHRYSGHDNNRDWMHHRLAETRVLIEQVHKPWRPHIVLDLHQMQTDGCRYFIPPYIDPLEPNVDPQLVTNGNTLGNHIAARLAAAGHAGVATNLLFDCYSPSRAWSHYHGGVRILAEAASAKIASPIDLKSDDLATYRGFDPRLPRIGQPMPWQGGIWRLRDIMDYHRETILATIDHAARHRETWIADQWRVLARAVHSEATHAYVIPPLEHQLDPAATRELLSIMLQGEVTVERLTTSATDSAGRTHARGSYLLRPNQPFFSWANALIPPTAYPSVVDSHAYDVTTHSLAVHLGVEASLVEGWLSWASEPVISADELQLHPLTSPATSGGRWITLDARSHAAIQVALEAATSGTEVHRLTTACMNGGKLLDPGTWLLKGGDQTAILTRANAIGVRADSMLPTAGGILHQRVPRIGLFLAPSGEATDAGWVQLTLETLGVPFQLLDLNAIQTGDDLDGVDVILLPHLGRKAYAKVLGDGDATTVFSGADVAGLRKALDRRARVVAIDGSAALLTEALGLPVDLPLVDLDDATFSSPGAMVRTTIQTAHPLAWGMDHASPALLTSKNAFRRRDQTLPAPVRFGTEIASGWMQGPQHLGGLDAVVDVPVGHGHVTLMAIRPHYRAQVAVTLNLLINALMIAGLEVRT